MLTTNTPRAEGVMVFWTDIEPDYTLRFQEWHNCEHMPERLSVPGFRTARRYRGIGSAANFLIMYEVDAPAVFSSGPYQARLNDPTPWTREALANFRNPVRNIYRTIAEAGQPPAMEAPYAFVMRFNLDEAMEDDAVEWLATKWLPAVSNAGDVFRGRLYQVDAGISGIMTSERKIYGGGPGQQKYLAIFEAQGPNTQETAGWQAAERGVADPNGFGASRKDLSVESSWLEIVLRAP